MKKRILSGLLCLVLILALTAQIVPVANASWSANLSSPIHLKAGQEYKKTWIITYVGIDDDTDISVEGTVPGISFITERGYTVGPSALFYYEGTPTMPGTYSVTLRVRKPEIGLNKEVTYTFEIDGDISVNSVNLVLSGYGAGASVSGANIQIKTEGVEFAAQGAANGFVFQATDSRTAAPITSGTFQENADYYVMVVLDIKSGYLRNYDTDNVTLTVNGQAATKAKGGMNNIAGNNGNSKLLVRFKLPKLAHTHTPGGAWLSDGTNHWKLCDACGEKAEVAAHSGGENSCRYKAQCDVCEAFYGDFADHDWSKKWDYSDEKGHYHTCQTPGCDQLSPVTSHKPGPAATETTPQTCKDCGYVLEVAQNHTHKAKKVAAVEPSCTTDGNIEYYECEECGKWFEDAKATKEITQKDVVLEATGHSLEDKWYKDEYTHWQECACGEIGKKAAHLDENEDKKCDVCRRKIGGEDTDATEEATKPSAGKTEKPSKDKTEKPATDDADSGNTGMVILVCVLAVLVLGAGAALAVILIKRKGIE